MFDPRRAALVLVAMIVCLAWTTPARVTGQTLPHDVTYDEAAPVIAAAGSAVPPAIARSQPAGRAAAWSTWVADRRAGVARRLLRGDEDSLVPLLLFGTSYTTAPRITRAFLERAARPGAADSVEQALTAAFEPRVDDLLRALAHPAGNERLEWARATMERLGHRFDTPQARARAGRYLVETFARVTRESGELVAALQSDTTPEGGVRARVFADRGLAPDTAWPVNFAVRGALEALLASGAIAKGSIRRVAVVGPGLDFVDKQEGHDFYPPQSLQPFAIVDALAGLGLSPASNLEVVAFDVNPRIVRHVDALATRPPSRPYDLQLVRDGDVPWTAAALRYFEGFGGTLGASVAPVPVPAGVSAVETRAVRVAAATLRRLTAVAFDIVYQRLTLSGAERFDLVVATNVLLYYDRFEQGLAASGIHALLRPGGLLLTNTQIDDVPAFPLRRVQRTRHVFSDRPGDGEFLFAYR
jgi:hypothetical protein